MIDIILDVIIAFLWLAVLILFLIFIMLLRSDKQDCCDKIKDLSVEKARLEERLRRQQGLVDALEEALDAERKG